jgi:hypothetical protein
MKTLFRTTLKKATRVVLLVPLVIVLCKPLFGASETKPTQWEYIVATFIDGQFPKGSFLLSEDQKKVSDVKDIPSKFVSIYPRISSFTQNGGHELRYLQKVLDELGRDGWELVCPLEVNFWKEIAFIFKRPVLEGEKKNDSIAIEKTFFDLDDELEAKLLNIDKLHDISFKRNSAFASDFKFKTKQVTKIIAVRKKFGKPVEEINIKFIKGLSEEDVLNGGNFSVYVDLEPLVKDRSYRKSEIAKVFNSLKTDLQEFTSKNKLKKAWFKVLIKCDFIPEIAADSDLVAYIAETSSEGVSAVKILLKQPDGSNYLPSKDHPSELLKNIFSSE